MSCYQIFFSPTGGTKKVADIVCQGFAEEFIAIDLIRHPEQLAQISFAKEDFCVIAVPAFGGRIPDGVAEKFQAVNGSGATTVLIAVYGNRAIDDTLIELQDVVCQAGFSCLAAIEAVAEHSLMHQFGAGRPDAEDEMVLKDFAIKIQEKFSKNKSEGMLKLPGKRPYKEYHGVPLKPKTNGKCNQCGLCAKECPTKAILLDHPFVTDTDKCISCMHCVSICPQHARYYSRLLSFIAARKMKKACSSRKENKLYL